MHFSIRWGLIAFSGVLLYAGDNRTSEPEWTFERARREWKPMQHGIAHVGVPGYEWQAGVLWNGALFFGPEADLRKTAGMKEEAERLGNNLLHVSVGYGKEIAIPDRLGRGSTEVRHSLDEGYLPIPHVTTAHEGLKWDETVFARLLGKPMTDGMQPADDDVLVAFTRFKVSNPSAKAATGHLWLHFGDTSQVRYGYKAGQGAELGPAIQHTFAAPFGTFDGGVRYILPKPAAGELSWHDKSEVPAGMHAGGERMIEWTVPIPAHAAAELVLMIPYRSISKERASALAQTHFEDLLADTRRFWRERASGSAQITTPDPFINDYLKAVPGQIIQQIGYRHLAKVWMYKTSPNHYEFYWPCNGAKALPALDLRGLAAYSAPVLKSFVDTQTEDYGQLTREISGKPVSGEGFARIPGFLGNFHDWTANTLLLSHGLEMWALASHYRITRDRKWLGEGPGSPLNALLTGFDWVTQQRRRTMREENGHKVPHWGLLPAASAHDWLSGNTIFNDGFCIFGMIETVRLLREIGHPRAEEMSRELNEYRKDLHDRYAEARDKAVPLPLPDGTSIPYVPRDTGELDWDKVDWTYTGYSPLRCGAWGALDPHDPLVDQALAFVEAGLPKGRGYYIQTAKNHFGELTADENFRDVSDPNAARHYMWRHYVEYETMWPIGMDLFLQRDDLPRFFEWYFNNMAIVLHHDFRVGVESLDGVPSNAPGDGERWRAVRDMFVNERGGYDGSQQSLWLLQAIPSSWMRAGVPISAKHVGTHFGGDVSVEHALGASGNSVTAHIHLSLAVAPSEIRVRLRSGNGRPLKSAEVNGASAAVLDGDTIRLPQNLKGEYRIVGRF